MRVVLVVVVTLSLVSADERDSFSYQNFRGPVSGQIYKIIVPKHHPNHHYSLDYVAKPDYVYSYGVEDPPSGNSQVHEETRDGDKVLGEYQVLQPDGLLRIVEYSADGQNGFKANVRYIKL